MPRLRTPRESRKPQAGVTTVEPSESAAMLFDSGPENDPDPNAPFEHPETNGATEPGAEKTSGAAATPEPEDEKLALKKQLDDLNASQKLLQDRLAAEQLAAQQAQQQRDEALRRAAEREKDVRESQKDAILSALAAAQAEADKAQQDIENAISNGDAKAQAEAHRRLAKAEAAIDRLEDGKAAIEKEVQQPVQQQQQVDTGDPIDRMQMPFESREMLKKHRDYLTDQALNADLNAAHHHALKAGHGLHSQGYRDFIATELGWPEAPKREEPKQEQQVQQQQRAPIVSAPVSRETPSAGTGQRSSRQITLTAEQREYAKVSGITEAEYARQLQKLQEAKANGQYTGGQ